MLHTLEPREALAMEISLTIVGGKQAGMAIAVRRPKFLIGRGEECQLRPQSHLVSRKHCAILVEADKTFVEDFGSTNGTFVNGEKIEQRQELHNGDRLKIGLLELELHMPVAAAVASKPLVQEAPQAPVRAAAPASVPDGDLDISSWLAEDDDGPAEPTKPTRVGEPSVGVSHDTIMGKSSDDTTTTIPADHTQYDKKKEKEKEKKPPAKIPGRFTKAAKPAAESSRSAAEDMLRQFFPRKKS
jgi:predicted component of type VI protein secretion system